MTTKINLNLNADMGEGFGAYDIGDDVSLRLRWKITGLR
jgi:lactam utilization protein B